MNRQKRKVASALTTVLLVSSALLYEWYQSRVQKSQLPHGVVETPPSKKSTTIHDPLLPSPSEFIHSGAYTSSYNPRLRNPNWSCVHLSSSTNESSSSRLKSKFKPDEHIPEVFRIKPEEFTNSGFDRGHLTAAKDVSQEGQDAMDESFLMTNISPQQGVGMNRTFWRMLEDFTRRLSESFEDVYVCSGPLFLPEFDSASKTWRVSYRVIGPNHDIAVPTHFFKCIHAQKESGQVSQACFVVPNRVIDHKNESLESFAVQLEEVEKLSGFTLFGREGKKSNPSNANMLCDQVKCQLVKDLVLEK